MLSLEPNLAGERDTQSITPGFAEDLGPRLTISFSLASPSWILTSHGSFFVLVIQKRTCLRSPTSILSFSQIQLFMQVSSLEKNGFAAEMTTDFSYYKFGWASCARPMLNMDHLDSLVHVFHRHQLIVGRTVDRRRRQTLPPLKWNRAYYLNIITNQPVTPQGIHVFA